MVKMPNILIFILFFIASMVGAQNSYKYFGEIPPELIPKKFAPGIVSTEVDELNCVFTPDGKECIFCVSTEEKAIMMSLKFKDGQWTERSVLPFSGNYSDVDPYITSDGKRLYFSSRRPLNEDSKNPKDPDIWFVEKQNDGSWGNPKSLNNLNTENGEYYSSITDDGTIYLNMGIDKPQSREVDVYKSKKTNGYYTKPIKLDYPINTDAKEHDPFISPDENYLIFSSNRNGGFGEGDLYISFKKPNGHWTNPINMGENINTDAYEYCPMLSQDGKYLFFTRRTNGNGDIYWVSSKIIDTLKLELN